MYPNPIIPDPDQVTMAAMIASVVIFLPTVAYSGMFNML